MHLPNPRFRGRQLLLLAAALALAGCANEPLLLPIAGGQKAVVGFGKRGVVMVENDEAKIDEAAVLPTKDGHHLAFILIFTAKNGFVPREVKVEDVTGNPVMVVCTDLHPSLIHGMWYGPAKPVSLKDPAVKWVFNLDDSIRVYRFILTGADGRVTTLDQGAIFPARMKMAFRYVLGLKY